MARAEHSPSLMILDVTAQSAQSVDISDAKVDAVFDFVGMPDDVLVRVWRVCSTPPPVSAISSEGAMDGVPFRISRDVEDRLFFVQAHVMSDKLSFLCTYISLFIPARTLLQRIATPPPVPTKAPFCLGRMGHSWHSVAYH